MKLKLKIINRVDYHVNSILISFIIGLLELYVKRNHRTPVGWTSVESVNRNSIASTLKALQHKKKILKETRNEKQEP